MFSYEINIICDNANCSNLETTEPKEETQGIAEAIAFVAPKGWKTEVSNGKIRTFCPQCAGNLSPS